MNNNSSNSKKIRLDSAIKNKYSTSNTGSSSSSSYPKYGEGSSKNDSLSESSSSNRSSKYNSSSITKKKYSSNSNNKDEMKRQLDKVLGISNDYEYNRSLI